MLGLLNMFSGQNDRNSTGVSSDDLNEIISMSLEFSKRHQVVLILLCGSIIDNYDAFLNNLATQMYNCGIIDDQTVEKKGLLQILSGNLPVDTVVRELVGTSNANRKLRYISSFHQMQYDMQKSMLLLNKLQSLTINNQVFSPIVLNISIGAYQTVNDICPELWNHSLRYMKKSRDSVHNYQYPSTTNTTQLVSNHLKDSMVGYDVETKREVPHSGYNIAAKEKRVMEETVLPWYKKNLELLETETDGMTMLLKKYNSQVEIFALPQSKRLNWKFMMRLAINNVRYVLHMRIVYPETFSENHLDVGVVIENADQKMKREITRNKFCKQTIYKDPEFDRLFIIERVYKGNNKSAAAAAFEGLLELLNSFN